MQWLAMNSCFHCTQLALPPVPTPVPVLISGEDYCNQLLAGEWCAMIGEVSLTPLGDRALPCYTRPPLPLDCAVHLGYVCLQVVLLKG